LCFSSFHSFQTNIVNYATIFEVLFKNLPAVGYTRKGNVIAFKNDVFFEKRLSVEKKANTMRTRKEIKNKERVIC
jgi:hypothetical protein